MDSRPPALQRGDVVACGKRHGVIVATRARCGFDEVFVVPIERTSLPRHRADVAVPAVQNPAISYRCAVARCGNARWARFRHGCSLGSVTETVLADIAHALRRERAARQVEELPPGIVKSHLGRGPKMGDRGRKVGGAPTD